MRHNTKFEINCAKSHQVITFYTHSSVSTMVCTHSLHSESSHVKNEHILRIYTFTLVVEFYRRTFTRRPKKAIILFNAIYLASKLLLCGIVSVFALLVIHWLFLCHRFVCFCLLNRRFYFWHCSISVHSIFFQSIEFQCIQFFCTQFFFFFKRSETQKN